MHLILHPLRARIGDLGRSEYTMIRKEFIFTLAALAVAVALYFTLPFAVLQLIVVREQWIVTHHKLPDGTTLADAVPKRTPGCTQVAWSANDLAVFADVTVSTGIIHYAFCADTIWGGRVAAANGRTEKAFPEISLGIGFEGDALFHPFMLKAQEQKRK